MSEISGLSEDKVRALCLDIQDCIEQFHILFNRIDEVMNHTAISFQGELSSKFKEKYRLLSSSYNVVEQNLWNYIDDFQNVIKAYQNQDVQNATIIQNATVEVLEEGEI